MFSKSFSSDTRELPFTRLRSMLIAVISDLAPAVEIIRPLMLNRVFGNVPSLRCGLWDAAAHQLSKDRIWPDHQGRPVPEDVENRLYVRNSRLTIARLADALVDRRNSELEPGFSILAL